MTAKQTTETAGTSRGAELVDAIVAEMSAAGLRPDSKESALLEEARRTVDRLDQLDAILADTGPLITTKTGQVRAHPALVESRLLTATLARVLSNVTISDTSAGKNPTKVRAANLRWAREAERRETIARAAEHG